MRTFSEAITELNSYTYSEGFVHNGREISLPEFVYFVGFTLVARDTYPGLTLHDACIKLNDEVMAHINTVPVNQHPMSDLAAPVAPDPDCKPCGGGQVR